MILTDTDMLRDFLKSKGCTLWMQWDITDDEEVEEAIDWIVDFQRDLHAFYLECVS